MSFFDVFVLYGNKHSCMQYKHTLRRVTGKSQIFGGLREGFLIECDKERYLQMCDISGIPAIILELSFYFPKKIEMSDST